MSTNQNQQSVFTPPKHISVSSNHCFKRTKGTPPHQESEERESLKDAAVRETKAESGIDVEVGYFKFEKAVEMVTFNNVRQRIESCLDEEKHPFYVEF